VVEFTRLAQPVARAPLHTGSARREASRRWWSSLGSLSQWHVRERRKWAARVRGDVLPVEYHHLILTLPHELTELVLDHGRVLFPLMLRAGAEAILQLVGAKYGAHPAVLSVLHLCGQLMNAHVHSHTLVSAGGLSLDGERWITAPPGEFLPLDELARTFRDLFLKRLDSVHRRGKLVLKGTWWDLHCGLAWAHWLASFRTLKWIVHSRSSWEPRKDGLTGGVDQVVEYLARYANRTAISNRRLLAIEGDQVRFHYKDNRDGGQWKTTSLPGVEFIERFLRYLWPPRMRHIRRFGIWGNGVRKERLAQARKLLAVSPPPPAPVAALPPSDPDEDAESPKAPDDVKSCTCRECGAEMMCTREIPRPPVYELMAMPPSMGIEAYGGGWPLPAPLVGFT